MIWERWRASASRGREVPPPRPFEDVLEDAPLIALLIDRRQRVIAANAAARSFFGVVPDELPAGLVEATREGHLVDVLRAGRSENEVRLVHRNRVVTTVLVPGPSSGETLMFLIDVTELRRLATVRQEFVANLTHELKTPLTSLRLALETLLGKPPTADQERFLQRALRETDQLDGILDNLRQLADLESDALRVRRTRFNLRDLVEDVRERLRYDRPLTLEIEPGLEVEADETKTAQVLANLFDNAARFSPPGSAVDVSARSESGELVVRIRDHGPGLAPEHWARVFERFYKVDPARPRQSGGSGLGLSISRHLVLAQGGRIWTEAAEGGGQVFAFALPLAKP